MGKVVASASVSLDGYMCLELDLLDELAIDLVPVVMGGGRPFFGDLPRGGFLLEDPTFSVQGDRVTHLVFPVRH